MVADKHIEEFVKRLRQAAGDNLRSVIVYGSAATEEFRPEFSDINLFCVLHDSSFASLQAMSPAVSWWVKNKQPAPLCMTQEELTRSSDVFTIELMDMQQHHRVAYGEDILSAITVQPRYHRIQVEYELREKLLLLRQHFLSAGGDESKIWQLLTQSASSFVTLFRHTLIVLGQPAPLNKRDVVKTLATKLTFDPSGFLSVLDVRQDKANRKAINTNEVSSRYLAAVEHVTAAVDKILDSDR
jgi:hypothetical protein